MRSLRYVISKDSARRRVSIMLMRSSSPIVFAGLFGAIVAWYHLFLKNEITLASYGITMTVIGAYIQERTSSGKPYQVEQFILRSLKAPASYWETLVSQFPIHVLVLLLSVVMVFQGVYHLAYAIARYQNAYVLFKSVALILLGNATGALWIWSIYKLNQYTSKYLHVFKVNPDAVIRRVRRMGWRLIIAGSLFQLLSSLTPTSPNTFPAASPSPLMRG